MPSHICSANISSTSARRSARSCSISSISCVTTAEPVSFIPFSVLWLWRRSRSTSLRSRSMLPRTCRGSTRGVGEGEVMSLSSELSLKTEAVEGEMEMKLLRA